MDDAIGRYLRELEGELLVNGRERERILAGTEEELRASEQALIEDGMRAEAAAAYAVERFGDPAEAGARFNRTSLRAQLHGVPWYVAVFVAAGSLALGMADLLGSLLSMPLGARAGVGPAFAPRPRVDGARTGGLRGFEEFLGSIAGAAWASALLVSGTWLLRRREGERGARARFTLGLLAFAAFGMASLLMVPVGIWQSVRHPGTGGGYWLVSGLAATGAFLVYAAWALSDLRTPAPSGARVAAAG